MPFCKKVLLGAELANAASLLLLNGNGPRAINSVIELYHWVQ